jgi:hypothetical protein
MNEAKEKRMLIEQRTYDIDPGVPMAEFLNEYSKRGLPAQKRILEGFLGYFVTEFGTQNQVNHFWAYSDLEDRRRRRAELAADAEWQDCISVVRPMIIRWDNKIMYPTDFSPIRALPVASSEPLTAFTYNPTEGSASRICIPCFRHGAKPPDQCASA